MHFAHIHEISSLDCEGPPQEMIDFHRPSSWLARLRHSHELLGSGLDSFVCGVCMFLRSLYEFFLFLKEYSHIAALFRFDSFKRNIT